MSGRQRFSFDPEWRITLFTAILLPVMVALGFWQLQRAEEKAALSAVWAARQQQAPAALTEVWHASADALAYLPVTLEGRFSADRYFLLDNRVLGGRFGYEVLGIMQLENDAGLVLVNRGWIAGDAARLALPQVPAVTGTVTVQGFVYVAPGAPYLLAEQQLLPGWPKVLQAIEMDKLATVLDATAGNPLFPFPVRLNQGEPGALTVDWAVVNVSPEKHRAYAVQWFTMAAVLLIFYLLRCSNIWQMLKTSGK